MHSGLKIVHVLRGLDVGGAEMMAVKLANWQVNRGHRVTLVAGPGPLIREVDPRIDIVRLRRSGVLFLLLTLVRVVRSLGRDGALLHAHQRREALVAWFVDRLTGATAVEHAHTELPSHRGKVASFRTRHVFAVSEPVATQVREVFRRTGPISIVDNVPGFSQGSPIGKLWSGTAAEPLRVAGIGRISEQKDPWRFVDVVQELGRHESVVAVWAGGGDELQQLRERDDSTPVDFIGEVSDVSDFLRRQHVVVLTSRWEGLPLVALEALAAGVPVVATAVGGLPSLLEEGGAGVCVPADLAPGDFAREIVAASRPTPERAARVSAGLAVIANRYSPDAAFTPIEETYLSLTRRGR